MHAKLITRWLSAFLLGAVLLKAVPAMEKQTDGILLARDGAFLKIEVRADNIIRVAFAKDRAFFARPSLAVEPPNGPAAPWELATTPEEAIVSTAKLSARVNRSTGAVAFFDPAGRPCSRNARAAARSRRRRCRASRPPTRARSGSPAPMNRSTASGRTSSGSSIIKGYDLDLWQHNGTVGDPVPRFEPRLRHSLGQSRRTRASAICGRSSRSPARACSTPMAGRAG